MTQAASSLNILGVRLCFYCWILFRDTQVHSGAKTNVQVCPGKPETVLAYSLLPLGRTGPGVAEGISQGSDSASFYCYVTLDANPRQDDPNRVVIPRGFRHGVQAMLTSTDAGLVCDGGRGEAVSNRIGVCRHRAQAVRDRPPYRTVPIGTEAPYR